MTSTSDGSDPTAIRVQKYLSQAGAASRREAERLILQGRVSVNGQPVERLGTKVIPGVDVVKLDDELVEPADPVWIVYNKPTGALTTRHDPHGGTTIYDLLPEWAGRLWYVGRLDRDTSGLLLLTNQGDDAAVLAHPRNRVEREYRVTVKGEVTARVLRSLKAGVELDDGLVKPRRVRRVDSKDGTTELVLVLTEGRKREVRRLMKAVGHPVVALRRVRFGAFELGELGEGQWRTAHRAEIESVKRKGAPAPKQRRRRT